uniref:Uncharacterized protein n=1 Tax=Oryza meridionalis TaxID=40149 RepID=A0A0E0BZD2_9ORYZ
MKGGNCYNETTMIRTPDTGAAVAMAVSWPQSSEMANERLVVRSCARAAASPYYFWPYSLSDCFGDYEAVLFYSQDPYINPCEISNLFTEPNQGYKLDIMDMGLAA